MTNPVFYFLFFITFACFTSNANEIEKNSYTRFYFGGSQLSFDEPYNHAETLYGKKFGKLSLSYDYLRYTSQSLSIGGGLQLGFVRKRGKAAILPTDEVIPLKRDLNASEVDPQSSVLFSMNTLDLNFLFDWEIWAPLHFSVKVGAQMTHYNEKRLSGGSYVNSGIEKGLNFWIAFPIEIHQFDKKSVKSLEILDIRSVFLTPFLENVSSVGGNGVLSPYQSIGLSFGFGSEI